jgi:hypothetical protein
MDQIYRCAALTVIANGEENSRYGLPGVGSISRIPQSTIRIGSEDYTLCWINTRGKVEQSEWSKRGWTFQDGLLSVRQLVFTETQIYFQCNELICMEMVSIPLLPPPREFGHTPSSAHYNWQVFPHHRTKSTEHNLPERIAEYRTRKLTYKSDRYNAFHGILHNFRQMQDPVDSLYGVPLNRYRGSYSPLMLQQPNACDFPTSQKRKMTKLKAALQEDVGAAVRRRREAI